MVVLAAALFIVGCAQQGAPTGGPQDEDPPKVLSSTPDNYSVLFDGKQIEITFDEFINTGSFSQELVVSPPMKEKPVVRLRNKTLIVEFEDTLKSNTTYTFNFGEGIKDLNEGNLLLNYEFVFSTGEYLDSLSVKGTLKNAFDLGIPESPISVMLYNVLEDSLPLKEIPYYIGRADKEGNFAVNNLRSDRYMMFVLKDANNNFIYDQPTESIAFLDSTLRVDGNYFKQLLLASGEYDSTDFLPDTTALSVDTTGMPADSIAMILDSLQQGRPDPNVVFIDLRMFEEASETQFITDYSRETRYKSEVIFNLPVGDRFSYSPVFPEGAGRDRFIEVFGKQRDTLTLWMGDTLMANNDTVSFEFSYLVKDSTGLDVLKPDTLDFVFRTPSGKGRNKNNAPVRDTILKLNAMLKGGKQDFHQNLVLEMEHPLGQFEPERMEMFHIPDTVDLPVKPEILPHPGNIRRLLVKQSWEAGNKYKLVLYPGAVNDVYDRTHDTLTISFSTKSPEDYGIINLELTNISDSVIIQLFNKETLTRERVVTADGTYTFEYMDPATYRIKFIIDRNGNGKWDTGDYLEKRQPERVEYLQKDISVRANWDHDVSYVIGSSDSAPKDESESSTSGGEGNRNDSFGQPGNNNQDNFDIPVQSGTSPNRRTPPASKPELPDFEVPRNK